MVRHHIKKKKTATKKQPSEKQQLEQELQNLDRFAGSSDEESDYQRQQINEQEEEEEEEGSDNSEEESDNDYQESDDGITEEPMKKGAPHKPTTTLQDDDSSESDNDYRNSHDDNEDEEEESKSTAMSNAMTRILGPSLYQPSNSNNIVLSKTTTPLQRLQQQIKSQESNLRLKRHERRMNNLSAMRLPLAPTAGMSATKLAKQKKSTGKGDNNGGGNVLESNAKAITAEIESERTHRRIATRGVVALFNAISSHRAAVAAEAVEREEEKKRAREEGEVKRKNSDKSGGGVENKFGFLERIRGAVVEDKTEAVGNEGKKKEDVGKKNENVERGEKKSIGWNALKDDFMMNSKLKDWDKDLSDDDDDEEEDNVAVPARKRVKA